MPHSATKEKQMPDATHLLKSVIHHSSLPGADWIGLRQVTEIYTNRSVRDGKPEENVTETSSGVMVEVLSGGQFAYVSTARTDKAGIRQAAERALALARNASAWGIHPFSTEHRPATVTEYRSGVQRPHTELSPGDINGILSKLCEKMNVSDHIIQRHATLVTVDTESYLVSSSGADVRQHLIQTAPMYMATAQDGDTVQTRSGGGHFARGRQGGLEVFLTNDLMDDAERVAAEAMELLSAGECPEMTASLVLNPSQMILQIHESIGHALELDRILGDERNYAGFSFVRPKDFGKLKYGSDLLNITFDPDVPNQMASYSADDNGCPARREYLIKDGILIRALGGLESQSRSGIPGVANARGETWYRAPIDRMANLNLEPGNSSLEEIIGSVKKGVLMDSNRSWSIDDYRRKFQFGCEFGRLIENGKLTRVVRNPNYRAITTPFWNSLVKVGDPSTFRVMGVMSCGKGEPNQLMRVGHASPVCLFDNVEIFGGQPRSK
jgi:predicted Zn-dependent protease